MAVSNHAAFAIRALKLLLNIIVVILYRNGDDGYFLGASYNKNHDAEVYVSGIFVGLLIYNLISILSAVFDSRSTNQSITETLMNLFGAVFWLTAGGVCIHYWLRFIPANHFLQTNPAPAGLAMGALAVINSAIYLAETTLDYTNYKSLE